MPSEKSARSAERRRIENRMVRSATRTLVNRCIHSLRTNGVEASSQVISQAISALDRAVRKGVLHPNSAARRKSRLMAKVNAIPPTTPAPPAEESVTPVAEKPRRKRRSS